MRYFLGIFGQRWGRSIRWGVYVAVLSVSFGWFMIGGGVLAVSPATPQASIEEGIVLAPDDAPPATVLSEVQLWNLTLQKQEDQTLHLVLKISNEKGTQTGIVYGVNVFTSDSQHILADAKAYTQDALTLSEGQMISKEITYVAPKYLKGEYVIEVTAKDASGLSLGTANLETPVSLGGSGAVLQVNPSVCFLSVDGESSDKKYLLDQGVDVNSGETLRLHCMIENLSGERRELRPMLETYRRTFFGERLSTEVLPNIVFDQGEKKDFSLSVTQPDKPQAYDAVLAFQDASGERIAAPVVFHYVVRGESATLENFTLDKNTYVQGETAHAVLAWVGSADNFAGARHGWSKEVIHDGVAKFALMGSDGKACAEEMTHSLPAAQDNAQAGSDTFDFPITRDCIGPRATVSLVNGTGKVLDQKTYVFSEEKKAEQIATKQTSFERLALGIVIVLAVGALLMLVFSVLKKRRRMSGVVGVIFAVIVGVSFFGSERALAGSFTVGGPDAGCWFFDGWAYFNYEASLDTDSVYPGGNIWATGRDAGRSCANGNTPLASYSHLNATINGTQRNVLNDTKRFTAPSTPGEYVAVFSGSCYNSNFGNQWRTYNIRYKVKEDAVCGAHHGPPAITACPKGALDVTNGWWDSETATTFSWTCRGLYGGADASCSETKVIDGSCGNDVNTCGGSTNTLIDDTDSTTQFLWRCSGYNGGATASCSKMRPGQCNNSLRGCVTGTSVNGLDDANYYRWTCQGAPDAACAAEVPKCSATHSGCAPGTSQSPGTTSTNYSWNCSNASVTGVPLASCNEARPQYFTLCYQNGGSGWVDVTTLSNSVVSVLKGGTVSLKALYGPNRNCSEAVNENSNVSLDASTKWDISPEDAGGNGTVSNYSGVKKIVFDTFYRASKGMRNKMDITVSTSKSVQAGSSNQHSISFSIGCTQTTGVCGSTEKINNTCLGEVYFATDTLCDNTPVTCSGGKRDCGSGYQEVAP